MAAEVNYNRTFMPRELKINELTTVGRASLILALMIGLSRLTGLGRTVVAAHFFGRDAQTDVFGAAFNIPDTLTILISGGLLATGFVPVFTRYLSRNETERARITFRALLTLMLVGFGGLSMGLFALTFTPLATVLYPKNIGPQYVDLFLTSLRILLVAQWIFVVGGVFSGTFNALRLFWFPALQPVFYNVGTIVGGVWGAPHAGGAGHIEYQAWGALGGAFVGTFVMLAPAARHHGLSLRPLWDLKDEGVRRVAASLLPIFLGLASGQIIALNLPRALASWLDEGALSSLDYANRLMQVPLDLLASSVAVALFPTISRLFIEENHDELRTTFDAAFARIIGAMLFASVMTIVLAPALVNLVFQSGKFRATDASDTALALQCYALCLPALGAQQLLARGFFATDRAREPVGIGLFAMGFFLVLGFGATRVHLGGGASLALAAAISTSVLSGLLWRSLCKHLNLDSRAALRAIGRGLLVAIGAGVAAYLAMSVAQLFVGRFESESASSALKFVARAIIVAAGGGAGVGFWLWDQRTSKRKSR